MITNNLLESNEKCKWKDFDGRASDQKLDKLL